MRRELLAAALALGMGAAHGEGCALVFGQGRNPTEAGEDAPWDALNQRFNAQVVSTLAGAGRQVYGVLGSTQEIDPAATIPALLRLARERGCYTLVETTLFVDLDTQTLIARLRVYPLLSAFDGSESGLRVGEPLYANQVDKAWNDEALARYRPELIAADMARDYLRRSSPR